MPTTERIAVKNKELVVRTDCNFFIRLLVIQEKRDVSLKYFLQFSLGQFAWSLGSSAGNDCKSVKSNLLARLKKKKSILLIKQRFTQREYMTTCVQFGNYSKVLILLEIYTIMSIIYKKTNRQYYGYYEWTHRYYEWTNEYYKWTGEYYEWTNEWTDEYCKWKNEYYKWINESCEWINVYYEWINEY